MTPFGCQCLAFCRGKKKEKKEDEEVEEESARIVIKAGMNDEFRGCGVERPDDRRLEGPPPILKVFLAVTPSLPCQHTPAFTLRFPPDIEIQGKFAGLYELNKGVNG